MLSISVTYIIYCCFGKICINSPQINKIKLNFKTACLAICHSTSKISWMFFFYSKGFFFFLFFIPTVYLLSLNSKIWVFTFLEHWFSFSWYFRISCHFYFYFINEFCCSIEYNWWRNSWEEKNRLIGASYSDYWISWIYLHQHSPNI